MHIFIVFHPQPTRCARVTLAPVWREGVDYKGNKLSSTFLKDETWPSIHSWSAKKTAKRGRDGSRLLTVSGKPGCCCPKEEGPGPHLSISAIGGKGGTGWLGTEIQEEKPLKNGARFSCYRYVGGMGRAGRARSSWTRLGGSSSRSGSPGVWHWKSALPCCPKECHLLLVL